MQQLFFFIQRFKYFIFYLFLVFISLYLTITNFSFHTNTFVNSANSITGGLYSKTTSISEYFSLKKQNKILAEENTKLKNLLAKKVKLSDTNLSSIDLLNMNQKYKFFYAKVINNSYTKSFNYLTIDKGSEVGIEREMAVINSKGIIGITDNLSKNYTRVKSILNRNTKINGRLKNSNYFGSLEWDGINYNLVQLSDLPRQAPIHVGDTIETGGRSAIFPEGIPIGTVSKVNSGNSANTNVEVTLFNDMSNLGYVYIIKNRDKTEIENLESIEDE